jgi:sugar phosphate isomerase/epimerase
LETGGGAVLPQNAEEIPKRVESLRLHIKRAKAMGSPLVRCLFASMRSALPPGPIERHIETMVRLLRTVRSEALDAGVKLAVEVHKDLQAWEFKMFLDEVGADFVGIYLDTGNPVFVLEHPLTTVETLGPYALTLHLRDSVVYEHPRGVAVHWVPLGEGVVDFKEIMARARELCPNVYVYVKPITGRPAEIIPYLEQDFWKAYPAARSKDLARFLSLAKRGVPYDKPVVNEDLLGRRMPEYLIPAIQHQQLDHMERSIEYAKKSLNLGRRWRAA